MNRRPNPSNQNSPFKVGDKICAIAGFGGHSYEPGRSYTVTRIDNSDQTLQARDSMGGQGNWINWSDCQKFADLGWEWLKKVLPSEALDLLAAFDGLEHLSLREDLRNRLVLQIPGLHEKILMAQAEEDECATRSSDKNESPKDLNNDDPLDFNDLDKWFYGA